MTSLALNPWQTVSYTVDSSSPKGLAILSGSQSLMMIYRWNTRKEEFRLVTWE
jgi:hypothetical protein